MSEYILKHCDIIAWIVTTLIGELWTLYGVLWVKIKYPDEKIQFVATSFPIGFGFLNFMVMNCMFKFEFLKIYYNPNLERFGNCYQQYKYYYLALIILFFLMFLLFSMYVNIFTNKRTVTKVPFNAPKWISDVLQNRNILLKDFINIEYNKKENVINIGIINGDSFHITHFYSKTTIKRYHKLLELINNEKENKE